MSIVTSAPLSAAAAAALSLLAALAQAQTPAGPLQATLFTNVRVFDGKSERLTPPMNVLVVGNKIQSVGTGATTPPTEATVTTVDGGGRTLMPGLIDVHTHLMFESIPQIAALTSDVGFVNIAAAKAAHEMLLRGFTSVRDVGGPVFGLKRGIDTGLTPGPRIWPSGAFISQSGGHGDFRLPTDLPARPGDYTHGERTGAAVIADDVATVSKRARELLALGASQLKVMAGGGVSSAYDPLDVTQYSTAEIRAAVEAAENWGTYVTVHAYTPRAARQAIEAGVKCIEHGQLFDEAIAKLMADKRVWWSLQPFLDDDEAIPFPEGSDFRAKQLQVIEGTDVAYALARKYKIRTAFGTDALFDSTLARKQGKQLAKLVRWYTPAQVLKMGTADNGELLALSGLRSPYKGKVGTIEAGAFADLLLVDGDPLANIKLIEDPAKNFVIIMKDGNIYKNSLAR